MCKFVAEVGISDFFMVGGDFRGAWKSAPAQLFTRIFLDAISPEVFRQACTSQLLVNDELYSQPMDLVLMVEREAKEWPRTHRLLIHASMCTKNQDYYYSGSRGYQQRSSVCNRRHLFPSSGGGIKQDRARYTCRLIERPASRGEQGV